MSNRKLAGALALLVGPLAVIAAVIVLPTLSDKAADQVAALDHHHSAMIAGTALQTVTVALFVAGSVWLALALSPLAARLAFAGGVLAVAGALVVLFVDSLHTGAIAATSGLHGSQATQIYDRVLSSRMLTVAEPL